MCGGGRWVLKDEGWQGVVDGVIQATGEVLRVDPHQPHVTGNVMTGQTPYWVKNKNSEGPTPEIWSRKTYERI